MDLQLFLALNALTISALAVAATLIYRPASLSGAINAHASWLIVNAAVVVLGMVLLWYAPAWAGTGVLCLFVPFVAAPVVLYNLAQRQSAAGRTAWAARLAWLAAVLHPTSANWMNARLLRALALSDDAHTEPLEALVRAAPPQYRPVVQAHLALLRRDWSEILALSALDGPADRFLKPLEVRALGETGQITAMVRCYLTAQPLLAGVDAMPKLAVLAFGGRPEAVARLLDRSFSSMDRDGRAYWAAVAAYNSATDRARGASALSQLAADAVRPTTRSAARRRLEMPTPAAEATVPAATVAALDAIAADAIIAPPPRTTRLPTFAVTVALIALNILGFVAEVVTGDATDAKTLIDLGALWPPNVLEDGEWWRLLTACFLHFGFIHIASNMFVLFVLGRLLEPMIGRLRLLAVYLAGGVLSSAFVLWLMWAQFTEVGLLVGASGAIFALFGAEVALLLEEWQAAPAQFDKRRLSLLVVILLIQASMDLSVPNISFSAHASGFVVGLVLMLALSALPRLSTRRPRGPIA